MVVLMTCKNEEDPIKNEGSRVLSRFPHYKSMGKNIKRSRAANSAVPVRIGQKFKLIRDILVVILTCKTEEDSKTNEGARVITRLYVVFADAQGHVTLQSVVEFRRNSTSSKLF